MSDSVPQPGLTLRYENAGPLELADLTTSLQAVSRRYIRFIGQQGDLPEDGELKLYVREIRPGSVIVDLVDWVAHHHTAIFEGASAVGLTTLAASQANNIIQFAKHLRDGFNWLRGTAAKPDDVPTSELRDLAKIMEPIAKDSRGVFTINASDQASVVVSVSYNSLEANAIQNRAEREIESRSEPVQKSFKQVLMYWQQASRGSTSRSDRAVIDSISERPLKVVFDDEDQAIKGRMISGRDNPFTIAFLVDVDLMTVRGRPVAYKVTRLYEVIDNEDGEQD